MTNLFNAPKVAAKQATRAMGIQLQGSQYGHAIPVVYGRNKVAGNCIWYGDFRAIKHEQKVGKGGSGGTSTSYTYQASFQLGLCEGQIGDVKTIYAGTSTISASQIGAVIATGSAGQAAWSHLSGTAALGYSGTAVFSVQNLKLGSSPTLPNYNFELDALHQYDSVGGIVDADPKDILNDVCTNADHGIGFSYLGDLTQYSDYCVANGLFLSPVYDTQQPANQALTDLFNWTNTAPYFSEKQLKVVPLGDTAVTGNGVTFTPNVTPAYDLGVDDFLVTGNDVPVTIHRKSPTDAQNMVRVEFTDRSQAYHTSAVVASIDEDVISNGGRADQSVQVDACTQGSVARLIAQNMVQRAFYVRNTYEFRLGWRYCRLEPTDIVTLTEPSVGLSSYPVRILSVEEDEYGTLSFTAEEFPEGIGHATGYGYEDPSGTLIDTNVDPGAVNSPFIFRGPGFVVNGSNPEIWCAVNGSGTYWAGCQAYISYDGTTYNYLGNFLGGARYGLLGTTLPSGSDPDTSNTPTVVLNAPGTLAGASVTDADNFTTMALVDTEVISYETATLTAPNTYQLGYLRRGGYGSSIASHSIGAPFARLDEEIIRIPVDPSLIGTTVYLKFLSINSFGQTPRDLSSETAYTYVVGTNVELPDVPAVPGSPAATSVADGVSITWTNSNPAAIGATSIEYSTTGTGGWTVLAQVGPTANHYAHHFTTGATYYYRLRARGFLVQSGWSAYTSTITNAGKTVADGADVTSANTSNDTAHVNGVTASTVQGYAGRAGAAIDSGNVVVAGGIDFTRAYSNKNQDNIPDTTTHIRGIQQSHSVGAQVVDNATFQLAFVAGLPPGWYIGTPSTLSIYTQSASPSPAIGSQYVVLATNSTGEGYINCTRKYSCNPGDSVSVGGLLYASSGVLSKIQADFYTAAGAYISSVIASTSAAAWTAVQNTGTVPPTAAYMQLSVLLSVASAYVAVNYVWLSVNDVRVAGSGAQIGDARNLTTAAFTGLGSIPSVASTLTLNHGGTVDVVAHSVKTDTYTASYSAQTGAITGLSSTVSYGFYFDDNYAGGSPTLNYLALAGTTPTQAEKQTLSGNKGRYYLGYGTIPGTGSSGSSGNPNLNTG